MQKDQLVLRSAGEAFLVEVTADWGLEGWRGVCEAEKKGKAWLTQTPQAKALGVPQSGYQY